MKVSIFAIFFLSSALLFGSQAFGEIDILSNIVFLETGILYTDENQFQISNDVNTREFSNGKIVRISGQTVEGFPYITYSKSSEDKIDTHGIVFVEGKFLKLSFEENENEDITEEKEDNLQILVQYTQRVYSKQTASIEIKLYDPQENILRDFNLNYGFVQNANIKVIVFDGNNQEFYSTTGITDKKGYFEMEFSIPERYPRETMTVTIIAENEQSKSSKIFEIFTLGAIPDNDRSP